MTLFILSLRLFLNIGEKQLKLKMPGECGILQLGLYDDWSKCLKLNLKQDSICEINCVGCGGKLCYGPDENFVDLCVSCFNVVFVEPQTNLFQRLQNLIKFNQYCKVDDKLAFDFFVEMLDYYTSFRFVYARNKLK